MNHTTILILLAVAVGVVLTWSVMRRRASTPLLLADSAPPAETPWLDHLRAMEGFTPTQPLLAADDRGGIVLDAHSDRIALLFRDDEGHCQHRPIPFARVKAAEVRENGQTLLRVARGEETLKRSSGNKITRLELVVTVAGEENRGEMLLLLDKAVGGDDPLFLQVWEQTLHWYDTLAAIIRLEELKQWLEGASGRPGGLIPLAELLTRLDLVEEGLAEAASLLERFGYGCEPDPRFTPVTLLAGDEIVLFPLSGEGVVVPGPAFAVATFKLHLAALVVHGEGRITPDEEQEFFYRLETLDLPAGLRTRLQAHARWLLTRSPGLAGLEQRLAALPEADRDGEELVRTAVAMAMVTVERQGVAPVAAVLRSLAPLLGLEVERLLIYLPDPEDDDLLPDEDGEHSSTPVAAEDEGPFFSGIDWGDDDPDHREVEDPNDLGDSLWHPAPDLSGGGEPHSAVADSGEDGLAWDLSSWQEPVVTAKPAATLSPEDEVIEFDLSGWETPAPKRDASSSLLGRDD